MFEGSILERSLYFVEENVQKLLSVLLNGNIHWLAFEVFEGEAELIWSIILTFS